MTEYYDDDDDDDDDEDDSIYRLIINNLVIVFLFLHFILCIISKLKWYVGPHFTLVAIFVSYVLKFTFQMV